MQTLKDIKRMRKLQQQRNVQRKPGDAEKKLQSKKDKETYAEKRKAKAKATTQRVSRAFEAVILGDKAEVLATLSIKAKSNDHAERILKIIMKNKSSSGKLTGNIRDWKTKTGKNRK